MTRRTLIDLRAVSCAVGMLLLSGVQTMAQEAAPAPTTTEPVKPSPEIPAAGTADKPDDKAEPQKPAVAAPETDTREAMCLMIESAAKAQDLPLEFFARVIWQESRFQSDAVGPPTRSGQHAEGIAQFMPGTAGERRLLDPFDPVQALPKSAEFLSELRGQFGNLGFAAAAYNAGPRRVREWLDGKGFMPQQTRSYVAAITGSSIDDWAAAVKTGKAPAKTPEATPENTPDHPSSCRALMALLSRAPNPFVTELEQHVKLGADLPWGVQLAAGFNRDRALAMYARAMSRLTSVIGDRDPSLLSTLFRNRGTHVFYQVRIGTDTRAAADDLCGRIRHTGQGCFVLRNMNVRG
jgi:cell division septation protein DedD